MTKHYCDACENELKSNKYSIDILVHIKQSPSDLKGHVAMVDGEMERVSSRTERTDLCISCYNKVVYPLWESIKKINKKIMKDEIVHYNEYKHIKTGVIYIEMDKCTIKLPSGDIKGVLYALPTIEEVFVRTQREFDEKFELVKERTAGGF